jgi:4'-phosphopantetheinyl transferase
MNPARLELLWDPPPARRQLTGTDIHVWAAALRQSAEPISSLESTLSTEECERAKKFHFERDRNRFIIVRGILRALLGSYVTVAPEKLKFAYGPNGKPVLADMPGPDTLHFNLAHSGDLMVIALTRAGAIGIDVEQVRLMHDTENIAARFFSSNEATKLKALSKGQQTEAFFNLWTRKEACLKAMGEGLSDEMIRQIEATFLPGEAPRVVAISGNAQTAASWTLKEFVPATGFVVAIAAKAKDLKFSCWQW